MDMKRLFIMAVMPISLLTRRAAAAQGMGVITSESPGMGDLPVKIGDKPSYLEGNAPGTGSFVFFKKGERGVASIRLNLAY